MSDEKNIEKALFAGGCFWCMQPPYDNLEGVISTTVGYTGGKLDNPTYEDVCRGTSGHTEAVLIEFDKRVIAYDQLLDIFWKNIDPTSLNRQFADTGSQYRTGIYYFNNEQYNKAIDSKNYLEQTGKYTQDIVTEILPAEKFFPAENYHQCYYLKNPMHYTLYKYGSGRMEFLKKTWGP